MISDSLIYAEASVTCANQNARQDLKMIICQLLDEYGVEHYIVEQQPFCHLNDLVYRIKCRYHDIEHLKQVNLEFVKMYDCDGLECNEAKKLDDGIICFNVKYA